jgi:uncharacterized protein YuzE
VRITFDPVADAAYIYLTDQPLSPGRDDVVCDPPDDSTRAFIVMQWKDQKIVGIEIQDASRLLHPDLLAQAQQPGRSKEPG